MTEHRPSPYDSTVVRHAVHRALKMGMYISFAQIVDGLRSTGIDLGSAITACKRARPNCVEGHDSGISINLANGPEICNRGPNGCQFGNMGQCDLGIYPLLNQDGSGSHSQPARYDIKNEGSIYGTRKW